MLQKIVQLTGKFLLAYFLGLILLFSIYYLPDILINLSSGIEQPFTQIFVIFAGVMIVLYLPLTAFYYHKMGQLRDKLAQQRYALSLLIELEYLMATIRPSFLESKNDENVTEKTNDQSLVEYPLSDYLSSIQKVKNFVLCAHQLSMEPINKISAWQCLNRELESYEAYVNSLISEPASSFSMSQLTVRWKNLQLIVNALVVEIRTSIIDDKTTKKPC